MSRRAERWVPWKLLAPALLVEAVLVLGPLLIGLWYSLHNVRFFQLRRFVGFENYARVLSSPEVLNALWVTAVFSIFALVLTFALGASLPLLRAKPARALRSL